MSFLQHIVSRKVGNPVSHKIEQLQERCKESQRYRSMQTFRQSELYSPEAYKIHIDCRKKQCKETSTEILKQRLKDREN